MGQHFPVQTSENVVFHASFKTSSRGLGSAPSCCGLKHLSWNWHLFFKSYLLLTKKKVFQSFQVSFCKKWTLMSIPKRGNESTLKCISQTINTSVSVGFVLRITTLKNAVDFLHFSFLPFKHFTHVSASCCFHGALNVVILFPRSVSLLQAVTKLLPNRPDKVFH